MIFVLHLNNHKNDCLNLNSHNKTVLICSWDKAGNKRPIICTYF